MSAPRLGIKESEVGPSTTALRRDASGPAVAAATAAAVDQGSYKDGFFLSLLL